MRSMPRFADNELLQDKLGPGRTMKKCNIWLPETYRSWWEWFSLAVLVTEDRHIRYGLQATGIKQRYIISENIFTDRDAVA